MNLKLLATSAFLASLVLSVRSECTETSLNALASKPSFLTTSNFKLENSKVLLRCTDGRVLQGFVSGGFFEVECNATDSSWIVPTTWPTEDKCSEGAPCLVAPLQMPSHLKSSPLNNATSGSQITVTCNDPSKILKTKWKPPFKRECYNGNFLNHETGPDFPPATDCILPTTCPVSRLGLIGIPDYMEHMATCGHINHGAKVKIRCKNNKKLTSVFDSDGDNAMEVICEGSNFVVPEKWPEMKDCQALCTSVGVPVGTGFATPPGISVLEGQKLTLPCIDNTYGLNTDWSKNSIEVTCQSDATFAVPSQWPQCAPRQSCGNPPTVPNGSGLKADNPSATPAVTQTATYRCDNQTLVTTSGITIELLCDQKSLTVSPDYVIPSEWGTDAMKCREKKKCGEKPSPPQDSGLTLGLDSATEVMEFDKINYTCSTSGHVMYKETNRYTPDVVWVSCKAEGVYESIADADWPRCDVASPEKCAPLTDAPDFLEPVDPTPVLPGANMYYKCKDAKMVPSLSETDTIKIPCVKSGSATILQKPDWWSDLKCIAKAYPDLSESHCKCLGDSGLTYKESLDILKVCNLAQERVVANKKVVPFKKRCGVKSLEEISTSNVCYCTEKANLGVDYAIWSIAEVSTYRWQANYSNPWADVFISFQNELQYELDRLILSHKPNVDTCPAKADTLRYVRSYVMNFLPGKPLQCSENEIPIPPSSSGLKLKERKSVKFGEHIEYECIRSGLVTNDGHTYKLRCENNGKFQNRIWLTCRERVLCTAPPPRAPDNTGLGYGLVSGNVYELDEAVYTCKDPDKVVVGSVDGKFRTPCKRSGSFEQSIRIQWPICTSKPAHFCRVQNATGYVVKPQNTYLVQVGQKVSYSCMDDDLLIGDNPEMSYTCIKKSDGTTELQGLNAGLPACRQKKSCNPSSLPDPSPESGLTKPLQSQDIEEGQYVEYYCSQGITFQLVGIYNRPTDFDGNDIEIDNGKLRLFCGAGGQLGSVTKWPKCRDSSITKCQVDKFPNVAAYGLKYFPNNAIPVMSTSTLSCNNAEHVTDHFKTATLTCNYDGKFIEPASGYSNCRAPENCPASPDPPAETQLVKLNTNTLKEFEIQEYGCNEGYTLNGVFGDLVSNGKVKLPCRLDSAKAFISPTSWPSCVPKKTNCSTIPSINGFTTTATAPVDVGASIKLSCSDSSKVTDLGSEISVTCTDSGEFTIINPMPSCRAPAQCEAIPTVPGGKRLQNSTQTSLKEFEKVIYQCDPGSKLPDNTIYKNEDGHFALPCGLGGKYPTFTWPTCEVYQCLNLDTNVPRFTVLDGLSGNIPINTVVKYRCSDTDRIANNSPDPINVLCKPNGEFDYPSPWPECRTKETCLNKPTPPSTTYLEDVNPAQQVFQFDHAEYACKPGSVFEGVSNPNIVDGKFRVLCQADRTFTSLATGDWPQCTVKQCMTTSPPTADHKILTTLPVNVNDKVRFACSSAEAVLDNNAEFFEGTCQNTGLVDVPTPPACRLARQCASIPPAQAGSNLQNSSSSNVLEGQTATYECVNGATYNGVTHSSIVSSAFHLKCPATAGTPEFETIATWPKCEFEKCVASASIAGMTAVNSVPIAVNDYQIFKCSDPTKVTDSGPTVKVKCLQASGQFETPPTVTCRAPAVCSNSPPTPAGGSNLLPSQDTNVPEFSKATYSCPEHTLLTDDMPGVENGKFTVECKGADTWDTVASWPKCQNYKCDTIPTKAGLTALTTGPVFVGAPAVYKCETDGQIFDDGKTLSRTCQADGSFGFPAGISDWPTCKDAAVCVALPSPPASNNFKPYSGAEVKEFGSAVFHCKDGMEIAPGVTTFDLSCPKGGAFVAPQSWPQCSAPCQTAPSPGLTPTGTSVSIGQKVTFACSNAAEITNSGKSIEATCLSTGVLQPDGTGLACRAAQNCPNTPPSPPGNTYLKPAVSQAQLEFDTAIYECMNGYTLKDTPAMSRSDVNEQGQFLLPCGLGGSYDTGFSNWPTCVKVCTSNLTPPSQSLEPMSSSPMVTAGKTGKFKCKDNTYRIKEDGSSDKKMSFEVTCQADGNFAPPSGNNWPTCVKAVTCPYPPTPPASSNLELQTSGPILEFDHAVYKCASGFAYSPADASNIPAGMDMTDKSYKLQCQSNGRFEAHDYWGTIGWPRCETTATTRRKRSTDFPNLHTDIEYSLLVIFETQFMYTEALADEIKATTNVTTEQYGNFSREMVLSFHRKLNKDMLGDSKMIKPLLKFGGDIEPLCDQPTNAAMTSISNLCVPTYTPAICKKEILSGAWIASLGYTHHQELPKWTNAASAGFNTPIGAQVYFYCQDDKLRPRKDDLDDDKEDGLLTTYCTHKGVFSMSMNPADWKRCKIKCPVEKPIPPTVPDAQMISLDDKKNKRKLWEDEFISFRCENASLVIDKITDKTTIDYVCQKDGTYSAPKTADTWPKCTPKPINPILIEAVQLTALRFDTDRDYRKLMSKGESTTEFLKTTEGIITITAPILATIFLLISCVMCCTRPKSCVWRIFEPQA